MKKILIIITEISVILSGLFLVLVPLSPGKLTPLPVPKVPGVNLPPPLELPYVETSVLGTEAIIPEDIVKYVNIERGKAGSKPLRISALLSEGARMRANVILKYQNFSHQDPYENIELLTVLPKINYRYSYATENIGMGGLSAEDFVGGFMHSTFHRINLLDGNLTDTGVAVVTGPFKQYYVNIAVQLFAIPGGRDEYLGYSFEDVKKYEEQLKELNAELNPVVWFVNKTAGNRKYNKERYQKLLKQKQILTGVYSLMKKEQPLSSVHASLILEYNRNLNQI